MIEQFDLIEGLTVLGIVAITVVAIFEGNSELAAAGVGGLVGYLTKAVRSKPVN